MLDFMSYLTGGGHRIKLKRHEYIRVGLIMLLILILIILFALELKYFSNTFNVKSMIIRALIFGAMTGVVLSYWITKGKKEMETLLKFQIWIACIICSVVMMPMLASLTNRYLSFSKEQQVPVELVKVDGFYAGRFGLIEGKTPPPDGYHIFIIKDGQLERIKSKVDPFPGAIEGDTVLLPMYKGLWGYNWVKLN